MPKWIVHIPEVWIQDSEIEAVTKEEAIERVRNLDGNLLNDRFEYSHTLDDGWAVDEVNEYREVLSRHFQGEE